MKENIHGLRNTNSVHIPSKAEHNKGSTATTKHQKKKNQQRPAFKILS
jgi:hypothetical protein